MLMNNGPWSPEHIYQEIAGYTATRHRGKNFKVESSNQENQIKFGLFSYNKLHIGCEYYTYVSLNTSECC